MINLSKIVDLSEILGFATRFVKLISILRFTGETIKAFLQFCGPFLQGFHITIFLYFLDKEVFRAFLSI